MKLDYKTFATLFGEAIASNGREIYISDWSTSDLIIGDPDNNPDPDWESITAILSNIWDVAHMSVKDIRQHTRLNQAAFAARFCLPIRTLENWECVGDNHRECPPYVRLLLADSVGLLRVDRV